MDNNKIWTEKYSPSKFEDIYLPYNNKIEIEKWVNDFINKKKLNNNCLLLHGPPGIGKTSIAHLILKKYDFDIIEFNASDLRSSKILTDKINQINGNVNIINFMCYKKKKIGIIIDELDGINTNEKGSINELIKIIDNSNKKNIGSPFICITNSLNKKISLLKKKALYIRINKPTRAVLKKLIVLICDKENIDIDNTINNMILDKSQLDFRRTIILMEYLFKNNKGSVDNNNIYELLNNYEDKTIDTTIYDSVTEILNNYKNDFTDIYNPQKMLLGYYIYENFLPFIIKNRDENYETKLDGIISIYDNFSVCDLYDRDMFINQNFNMLYDMLLCCLKCNIPSFIANNMKKFSYNKLNNINYSTLLNKTSLEYLNCKSIYLTANTFKIHYSYNIYICDICFLYLIKHKNIETIRSLIKYYHIEKDLLEKIIKQSSFYNSTNTPNLKKIIKPLYKNNKL